MLVSTGCGSRMSLSAEQREAATSAALGRGGNAVVPGVGGGPVGGLVGSTGGTASSTGSVASGATGTTSNGLSTTGTGGTSPGSATTGTGATTGSSRDNGGPTDVGVSATSISVGNVSDLSGPQPGLFQGAVNGTEAYFAYINSQGGVNGRQIVLRSSDGQTDCTANQSAHNAMVNSVFAFVGSFSLYDDCATTVMKAHPNVPNVSFALSEKAQQNTVNQFSPHFLPAGAPNGPFCYLAKKYPDLVKSVGSIYANIPSAAASQKAIQLAGESCGWKWLESIPVGATDSTFNAQVTRMRNSGVKLIFEVAFTVDHVAEMKREADAQGWKPLWVAPVAYNAAFLPLMGNSAAAEGVIGYNLYSLFLGADEAKAIPEVRRFQDWMKRVHPDAPVDLFGMYGWAAAKLFTERIKAVGPRLTQKAFLSSIRTVHLWNADGLLAQSDVAGHKPGNCYVLWKITGGSFRRMDSNGYRCDGRFVGP
jgi:ABC-type branched-subunit amino acid transport system substrate-binding protein